MPQLSALQEQVVAHIRGHSDATAGEIADALKAQPKTIAAALSSIVRAYPRVLVRREAKSEAGRRTFSYRIANGGAEPTVPLQSKRPNRKKPGEARLDVLLTLKIGRREAMTITVSEARDLLQQLLALQRYFSTER